MTDHVKHWAFIGCFRRLPLQRGFQIWGSNPRPGNVELELPQYAALQHKQTTPCKGQQGKHPMIAHCLTQCPNGCSLGSFLFPRQENRLLLRSILFFMLFFKGKVWRQVLLHTGTARSTIRLRAAARPNHPQWHWNLRGHQSHRRHHLRGIRPNDTVAEFLFSKNTKNSSIYHGHKKSCLVRAKFEWKKIVKSKGIPARVESLNIWKKFRREKKSNQKNQKNPK